MSLAKNCWRWNRWKDEQYTHCDNSFGCFVLVYMCTCLCTRAVDLERFINYVNGFHHALKFTWGIRETCVSFLDISVSINGNTLATSVSYKPTDSHSYLLFSSSHPNHTKQSIPYSQLLRLHRLCSDDKDFETKLFGMRTFFVERGYPTHLLDSAIQKAFSNSRRDTLKPPFAKISDDKIPLVLTFHPFKEVPYSFNSYELFYICSLPNVIHRFKPVVR